MNVNVYCVADQIDATRDIHKPQIPICGNDKIKYNIRVLSVFGVIIAPIANINKNAPMEIIWNVVLILPIEKRALGTGISIFCVPRNSRRPDM